ncbi:hypothetical protein D1007_42424 [Hordeum vulgare]|uniref:Predicted protein n=1 Tax=Hordeum vulgare subsp. vulgare TaxID=112509 RepID=F2DJ15_HORVV|nr:hypothetical protein D1007_42424 [Hordeum vulgare]BAJ95086.1 predicted protein [Hordeum vulgare subsp. vulgare]
MSSEAPKKMRMVYSREFLISIGESGRCKNLPPGVNLSLLNELQEASSVAYERTNRGQYTTPLGRSDGSGGYTYSSRGGSSGGRWDTRSTGSSDREGDLPDRESLTQDRHNGTQNKRTWQKVEHDGLLGSGGFPRPSGYAGPLAAKDRGNAPQPNRTAERYQPPRPYKAGPLSRKDVDSMNDETFGSFECSNDDRAEEEKKRRASFELMRKEQHKSLQEKKSGPGDDIMTMLQNSTENLGSATNSGKPDGIVPSVYQDTTKTSSVLPVPAARPLVPPGFSNAVVEKKVQSKTSNIALEPKAHIPAGEDKLPTIVQFSSQVEGNQSATDITASNKKEKGISDNIGVHQKHTLPSGGVSSSTELFSKILKGTEDWEADAMDKYSIEKQGMSKNGGSVVKDNSISILEEFFGNALSKGGGTLPTYVESQQLNTGADMMPSSVPESSKFARWFRNEDPKPSEDLPSKSLLSMIVNNDKPGPQNIAPGPTLSDGAIQNLSSKLTTDKVDASSRLLPFPSPAPPGGIQEQYSHPGIPEPAPVMMTCEDLEQAMLAQVASNSSSTQKSAVQRHQAVLDEPAGKQKVAVDNHASHHLLSLLQKGTNSKGSSPFGFHIGSTDVAQSSNVNAMTNGGIYGTVPTNKTETVPTNKTETVPASGKSGTLEALFGAAFMNELHSKDAPVSIRGSASSHEGYYPGEEALPFNSNEGGDPFKEPRTGIEYRNTSFSGPSQGTSFDKNGLEINLPEEDSLFTMSDSFGVRKPDVLQSLRSGRVDVQLPEKAVDDLNYKLQGLVSGDVEPVQVLGPDALGSRSHEQRYQVESQNLYHLLQGGRQPALAPRPMVDHVGNRSQQAPFDMPQAIRHDPRRSFPPNMNPMQHTLNAPGAPHVDPAAHHLMLQRMSGSFPAEGLPRGVLPSQPVHQAAGYRPEMNNVNNFHMHPRQPSYGDFGLMPPGPSGPEVRGNHPDAFERLMQMELTARSKQMHPAMAGPVPGGGGMYGPELDLNLRYR